MCPSLWLGKRYAAMRRPSQHGFHCNSHDFWTPNAGFDDPNRIPNISSPFTSTRMGLYSILNTSSSRASRGQRKNLPIQCAQGDRPARCPNHFFAVNEPSAVPWWWSCDLFWCHEVACAVRWSNVSTTPVLFSSHLFSTHLLSTPLFSTHLFSTPLFFTHLFSTHLLSKHLFSTHLVSLGIYSLLAPIL